MTASGLPVLKVAVVGHTNTGKTSLLRTLTRDVAFGEISDSPATTRHVEGATLLVDGAPAVELYDTPGLEDSIGLLEHIDTRRSDRHVHWIDVIEDFLASSAAHGRFEQEAKTLRQVLASDVALYVIDVRDRVLGKYSDELEILARCAKPVLPVLNFLASPEAKTAQWREHLARLNLHAVAEFDTVVLNELAEQRLFEKMQVLLDPFRPTLQALIDDRRRQRADLVRASADLLADLLIDVTAYTVVVPAHDQQRGQAEETLKRKVRAREHECVVAMLELFRFRPGDLEAEADPLVDGQWGLDLFNPASLRQFGLRAGGGATAGALSGLAIDAMTGGISLGAAAALGATVGALWGSFETHGRRMTELFRGYTELRVKDSTLRLLAVRQIDLLEALLRRGHASQDKIRLMARAQSRRKEWTEGPLPEPLLEARTRPDWSRLGAVSPVMIESDPKRLTVQNVLARLIIARSMEMDRP